ncbi:MAG: hypothetical protein DLM60_22145 [Pseudonocardiales bacterium]|nr:MAG: hypothetical protein DLM60_22145 [Pseudonocardiales bacterium]
MRPIRGLFEIVHDDDADTSSGTLFKVVAEARVYRSGVAACGQGHSAGESNVKILGSAASGVLQVSDNEVQLLVVARVLETIFDILERYRGASEALVLRQ